MLMPTLNGSVLLSFQDITIGQTVDFFLAETNAWVSGLLLRFLALASTSGF